MVRRRIIALCYAYRPPYNNSRPAAATIAVSPRPLTSIDGRVELVREPAALRLMRAREAVTEPGYPDLDVRVSTYVLLHFPSKRLCLRLPCASGDHTFRLRGKQCRSGRQRLHPSGLCRASEEVPGTLPLRYKCRCQSRWRRSRVCATMRHGSTHTLTHSHSLTRTLRARSTHTRTAKRSQ